MPCKINNDLYSKTRKLCLMGLVENNVTNDKIRAKIVLPDPIDG
jgi:hypothetical protein